MACKLETLKSLFNKKFTPTVNEIWKNEHTTI